MASASAVSVVEAAAFLASADIFSSCAVLILIAEVNLSFDNIKLIEVSTCFNCISSSRCCNLPSSTALRSPVRPSARALLKLNAAFSAA